jgi:hypothetical protein
LACIKAQDGELSFFVVEKEKDITRILAAIVIGGQSLKDTDYVIIDANDLLGFDLEPEDGDTKDIAVNKLHRNIKHLSASRISELANLLQVHGQFDTELGKNIAEEVAKRLFTNDIELADVGFAKDKRFLSEFQKRLGTKRFP